MKKSIFFSLYFSEGAPIGFIWWALPAILVEHGFSVPQTASLAAIAALPWSFKFIFAPMIDLVSLNYLSLKKQLFIYQVIMGIAISFISIAISSGDLMLISLVVVGHGIFAALQDICIDALAIKSIPSEELGRMNGIMQSGMLVGRSIFGGAGVYIAHKFGVNVLVYFLVSSIWVSLILLQRTNFPVAITKVVSFKSYVKDFVSLVKNKNFWLLIAITYFAGFSYNGISTIGSSVLSELGTSPELHGLTYSILLPFTMAMGALLAGYLSDKKGPKNILKFCLFFSIVSSIFAGLAIDNFVKTGILVLLASYIFFYFFIGSTTASLYSFLMRHSSKEFAALEFSIFMGIVNLSESSSSFSIGMLLEQRTYFESSLWIAAICVFSFFFLRYFKNSSAHTAT